MWGIKAFQAINSEGRISSLDVFRCIAIVCVVVYHFNESLPYGYLGVDLFFVISGLLVGGLLMKEFKKGNKINFFKFFLQRGFKIWPSYYVFLLLGNLLAIYFYQTSNPDQVIPFWNLKRYLFFYQNYTGLPIHWSFDHVWSLCVEEHFYVLLPLTFLVVHYFVPVNNQVRALLMLVILTIIAGFILRHCSYFLTNSKDTYSATHNRIDALAMGVLLSFILTYWPEKIRSVKIKVFSFTSGLFIFSGAIYFSSAYNFPLFEKIYLHSIIPFSFFLMLLGAYYVDFSRFKVLRVIAYYSYNWYLWHAIFVIFITQKLGNTSVGLVTYVLLTFAIAVIATIAVEETFLKKRNLVLDKLFKAEGKGARKAHAEKESLHYCEDSKN